jgi:hypothetical protein
MPALPRQLVLLVASLALSSVVSACGQAKEPHDTPPVAGAPARDVVMTRREFIARADAICEGMNRQSVAAAKQLQGRPVDEILARALAIQGSAIRELRALERPPGDEKQIEEVLRHMQRLQELSRMLDTEGEEILGVVAGIAVETDAVARAAKRYGLFRKCAAYPELPNVQRIMRGEKPLPGLERGPDGKPVLPALLRPPVGRPAPSPLGELRRLANRLVPQGREVVRRIDCTGDRTVMCLIIELDPGEAPLGARQAEIGRLAKREGWKEMHASGGERPIGMLQLQRGEDQASIRLVTPPCREQSRDGPDTGNPAPTRCVDTIMLLRSDY